jgi:hypothetical protein
MYLKRTKGHKGPKGRKGHCSGPFGRFGPLCPFVLIFFAMPALLHATDLMPWFSKDYEVQTRGTYLFQAYRHIQTPHRNLHHSENSHFYTFSGGISRRDLSGEVEATVANTSRQRPGVDNFRVTARYRLLNDVGGQDRGALTTGLTLTQAFTHSLNDISSFHHGIRETDVHLAVGHEKPCEQFWFTRWWGVFGLGVGDRGSPWIRGDLFWERNWWDLHQLRVFAHSLWGLGHNNLHRTKSFHGYGSIRHQSVDLGIRYSYLFEWSGIMSLEYAYRVYAVNFPAQANLLTFSLFYPIGL